MSLAIIIQARTGSTRLPNKMVLPFFEGKGIFEILIERIIAADFRVPVILATTINPADDILIEIAEKKGVSVFRGSEENVLERFIGAAEKFGVKKIIRVCADNPFLDMDSLKFLIEKSKKLHADYWCFAKNDGTPSIKTHFGFWAEGVSLDALKKTAGLTQELIYQEHVTNLIYTNPGVFSVFKHTIPFEVEKRNIRLTIDTLADFETAREIFTRAKNFKTPFNSLALTELIENEPIWIEAMQKEIQKNNK